MLPIVGVVGWHRVGKTTFIVGLIGALQARGLQVATIKHTSEAPSMDQPGTDTDLFARAGSRFVAIAGPKGSAILLPQPPEPSFWELMALVPADVDLVVIEGYKRLPYLKFEVVTGDQPLVTRASELLAVITRDGKPPSSVPAEVPVLRADDYASAVALLNQRGVLARQHQVNG